MSAHAIDTLKGEGIPEEHITLGFAADLRYVGQFNEVDVPAFRDRIVDADAVNCMAQAFHERHDSLYGYSLPGAPVELINVRLSARGKTEKPRFKELTAAGKAPKDALKNGRKAFFGNTFVDVDVYDGLKLGPGNTISGPAIVEQPTTTIVVTAGYTLTCDRFGNYVLNAKDDDQNKVGLKLASREHVQ